MRRRSPSTGRPHAPPSDGSPLVQQARPRAGPPALRGQFPRCSPRARTWDLRWRERDGVSTTPQPKDESDEARTDRDDYLDGQEEDSFPASDPHSDWSGPPPDGD